MEMEKVSFVPKNIKLHKVKYVKLLYEAVYIMISECDDRGQYREGGRGE